MSAPNPVVEVVVGEVVERRVHEVPDRPQLVRGQLGGRRLTDGRLVGVQPAAPGSDWRTRISMIRRMRSSGSGFAAGNWSVPRPLR